MTRFGKRMAILAALALGLSLGGTRAQADLTLTISDAGGPMITIDSTTGSATLTAPAGSYTYDINSQLTTFVVVGSSVTVSVPIDTTEVNFTANSQTSTFDAYSRLAVDATPVTGPNGSLLTDINTDVTAATGTAGALSITAGNVFTSPTGPGTVTSTLSASALQAGTVTFQSSVNGTPVPLVPLSLSAPGTLTASASMLLTSPLNTSNTLVISGLSAGLTDSITGTTTLSNLPEPATLAMVFSALPMLGIGAWRSRRKAS